MQTLVSNIDFFLMLLSRDCGVTVDFLWICNGVEYLEKIGDPLNHDLLTIEKVMKLYLSGHFDERAGAK